MSNAEQQFIDSEEVISNIPAQFNMVVAGIDHLKQQYGNVQIIGIDDKKGYEFVRSGIAELRTMRVTIEEVRQSFKRPLLDIGNAIDSEAKRITSALSSIEEPLKLEKKRIDDEKEAIKQAKLLEEQRLLQEEREKLAKAERERAEKVAAEQAERNRILAEENARIKAEADRVAAEQAAEMAKIRAEAAKAAEAQRLVAEAQANELAKIRAEKEVLERKSEEERAAVERAEAERKAAIEPLPKLKAEAEKADDERIAAEKAAEIERKVKAAQLLKDQQEREQLKKELQPDLEALGEFAATLDGLSASLDLKHKLAKDYADILKKDISKIVKNIYGWIGE